METEKSDDESGPNMELEHSLLEDSDDDCLADSDNVSSDGSVESRFVIV